MQLLFSLVRAVYSMFYDILQQSWTWEAALFCVFERFYMCYSCAKLFADAEGFRAKGLLKIRHTAITTITNKRAPAEPVVLSLPEDAENEMIQTFKIKYSFFCPSSIDEIYMYWCWIVSILMFLSVCLMLSVFSHMSHSKCLILHWQWGLSLIQLHKYTSVQFKMI